MKFYRVKKENFLWEVWAILEETKQDAWMWYSPIEDCFKKFDNEEYITSEIVENSPEYFERVYEVRSILSKTIYETKEKAMALVSKMYKVG